MNIFFSGCSLEDYFFISNNKNNTKKQISPQKQVIKKEKIGQAKFEETDCFVDLAEDKKNNFKCGFLIVPENRDKPDKKIKIAVLIFKAQDKSKLDPIVYLAGGPGMSALKNEFDFWKNYPSINAKQDFILFEQRGIGFSEPALECPSYGEAYIKALQESNTQKKILLVKKAILNCRKEYQQKGINLNFYKSADSAKDLEDLRITLNYQKLNLLGSSYGTRLALTTIRDYPQSIKSALLDSVLPIEANLNIENTIQFQLFLQNIFKECAADSFCNKKYPNLEQVFFEILDDLAKNPFKLEIINAKESGFMEMPFDDSQFLQVVYRSISAIHPIEHFPKLIYQIKNKDFNEVKQLLFVETILADFISAGAHFAINCNEELPFEQNLPAKKDIYPQIGKYFSKEENMYFSICQSWPSAIDPQQSIENKPFKTNIPILIFSGRDDFITPFSWSQEIAKNSSNIQHLIFNQTMHVTFQFQAKCAIEIIKNFFQDPQKEINQSCVNEIPTKRSWQ